MHRFSMMTPCVESVGCTLQRFLRYLVFLTPRGACCTPLSQTLRYDAHCGVWTPLWDAYRGVWFSGTMYTMESDSAVRCTARNLFEIRISRRNWNWIRKHFSMFKSIRGPDELENLVTHSLYKGHNIISLDYPIINRRQSIGWSPSSSSLSPTKLANERFMFHNTFYSLGGIFSHGRGGWGWGGEGGWGGGNVYWKCTHMTRQLGYMYIIIFVWHIFLFHFIALAWATV